MNYPKPADFQPEPTFPKDHKRAGKPRCRGWSVQAGRQCLQSPMTARKFCRLHGGKALRGLDSPSLKHAIYSKDLPARMVDDYEAALADPDRLSLDPTIALTRSRIKDLIKRVDIGESGRLWKETRQAMRALRKAIAGDVDSFNERLLELEALIIQGVADFAAWEEIGKQEDRHARLITTEMKRQQVNAEMMAITQVTLLFVAFANDIRNDIARHVEGETKTRILADAARTTDRYLHAGEGDIQ